MNVSTNKTPSKHCLPEEMMNPINHDDLRLLAASTGGPHLSLFLPKPEKPIDPRDDVIRLANACRKVRQQLAKDWSTNPHARKFLERLNGLPDDLTSIPTRRHAVAVYLSADLLKVYELNDFVENELVVAPKFRVRVVLPSVDPQVSCVLLTLSTKRVALFDLSTHSIAAMEKANLPIGFDDSIANGTVDRGALTHSVGGPAAYHTVYHGQSDMAEQEKADLANYLRRVDHALESRIDGERMVVLAGVDSLTAIYRQVSRHPWLADATISGSVDRLSRDQLFQRAIPIALVEFSKKSEQAEELFRDQPTSKVATLSEDVVCAAREGRVATLFVGSLCGCSEATAESIEQAIRDTLLHNGQVKSVASDVLPVGFDMAGTLRF